METWVTRAALTFTPVKPKYDLVVGQFEFPQSRRIGSDSGMIEP